MFVILILWLKLPISTLKIDVHQMIEIFGIKTKIGFQDQFYQT